MDFLQMAKARCSMRAFTTEQVDTDKINMIVEAGRIAPTAANNQPQKILKITDPHYLSKLNNSANTYNAPLVLIVCTDKNSAWTRPFDNKSMIDVDGAIVADHIVMTAESLGLGTCWITYFKPDVLKSDFNIPCSIEPIAIIAIGYDGSCRAPSTRHDVARKSLDNMVVNETF